MGNNEDDYQVGMAALGAALQRLRLAREELGRGGGARELSVAITNLEQALLWAQASRNPVLIADYSREQ